jgi:ligand-binding sensor domain-containing protein
MRHFWLMPLSAAIYYSSAAQQLHVENYTPANGLLDTRVIKIFQDNRGLIYFLTWEGISIFDGQRFKNISEYNGELLGLVNDMIQWKNEACYVLTFQRGVSKLICNRPVKDTLINKIHQLPTPYYILRPV